MEKTQNGLGFLRKKYKALVSWWTKEPNNINYTLEDDKKKGRRVFRFFVSVFTILAVIVGGAITFTANIYVKDAFMWMLFPITLIGAFGIYLMIGFKQWSLPGIYALKRFGYWMGIYFWGWHIFLLPNLIDKFIPNPLGYPGPTATVETMEINIYDQTKKEIEFAGGAHGHAVITAYVKLIGVNDGNFEKAVLELSVYRFAVKYQNILKAIMDIIEPIARSKFSGMSYEDALKSKAGEIFDQEVLEKVNEKLKGLGLVLDDMGIAVSDIILDEEVEKARELIMKKVHEAKAISALAEGIKDAIKNIQKNIKDKGEELTFEQAKSLFIEYLTLQALEKTGSNVQLVLPGIGAMPTLSVGKAIGSGVQDQINNLT